MSYRLKMINTSSITLKIVFIGSNLDPMNVTDVLNINPTDSYEKGFQRISGGKRSKPRSTGMWCYKLQVTSNFEAELKSLLDKFDKRNVCDIEGVERASLHVYLGLSNDEGVFGNSFDCVIDSPNLSKIQKMGLDVRITVA